MAASACFDAVLAATAALRDDFTLSRAVVGLAVTATVFGYTVALLPAGAASSRAAWPGLAALGGAAACRLVGLLRVR